MSQGPNKSGTSNPSEELELDTKRLIDEVRREGVDVGIPSNSISRELAEKIYKKYFLKNKPAGKKTDELRNELMIQALRKAQEIRHSLEGRQHSDSTNLIADDRQR